MPHAEQDTTPVANGVANNSSAPTMNGEKPHSKVLSHLHAYPLIHDSLELYKSNPYGAKSLSLINATYQRFVAPLHPYLKTPYSYVLPYLSRADELGDNGLSKVDNKFPIVKEETSKLKETVQSFAWMPFKLADKGKNYLFSTWNDEYTKTGGEDGVVKSGKAFVSTELKVTRDSFHKVMEILHIGQEKASKKIDEVKQ